MIIWPFVQALKRHLEDNKDDWTGAVEVGNTETGWAEVDDIVDFEKLNRQIDEFAKDFEPE